MEYMEPARALSKSPYFSKKRTMHQLFALFANLSTSLYWHGLTEGMSNDGKGLAGPSTADTGSGIRGGLDSEVGSGGSSASSFDDEEEGVWSSALVPAERLVRF